MSTAIGRETQLDNEGNRITVKKVDEIDDSIPYLEYATSYIEQKKLTWCSMGVVRGGEVSGFKVRMVLNRNHI